MQFYLLIIFNYFVFNYVILNYLYFLGRIFTVKCIAEERGSNFRSSIYY